MQRNRKRYPQYTYYNAVDVAMQNNQIRAVSIIIDHVIKYQDNFVSAYLFKHNLIALMDKGVSVNQLFKGNIFVSEFEYDEWPGSHTELQKLIRPYNGSIFDIRNKYREVFGDIRDPEVNSDIGKKEKSKFYKIKYRLNMIPFIDQKEGESIIKAFEDAASKNDELEVFSHECV